MSLKSALEASATRKGPDCSVGSFLESLTPAQRQEFDELQDSWSGAEMARAILAEYQVRINSSMILRHRRKDCRCGAQ
jgi:hypothetical protein